MQAELGLLRKAALGAAVLAVATLTATPGWALNVGYYEMCLGQGDPDQATPITAAGHTAVNLMDLTAADLAGVDVVFVDNCDNGFYGAEYLSRLADVEAAVAAGKVLVLHDRYVDPAESILPGGGSFDVRRAADQPTSRQIDVLDGSTILTSGPAGSIDDTTLDGGCESSHGFTVAGSLPGDARFVLSRPDPSEIVTFAYGFGQGVVVYSTIPLDFYLDGATCGPAVAMRTIYAVNAIHYAASLTEGVCGNGGIDAGEDCDHGADNNGESCCAFDCRVRPAGFTCRDAVDVCDAPEACDGASAACGTDEAAAAGTACADDGDLCTDDACDGAFACAHPAKPDADVDGTCDEQDACTNVGGGQDFFAAKPNLALTRVNADTTPGNDGLRLSADFQLAVGASFGGLDPLATGARLLLEGELGGVLVDQALPGGAFAGRGTRGWKLNKAGTTWSYTDATTAPLAGIKRVRVIDRSKQGARRVKVMVTGVKSTYPAVWGDAPLGVTVVLGGQASGIAGECGESDFGPTSCKLNGTATTITCR